MKGIMELTSHTTMYAVEDASVTGRGIAYMPNAHICTISVHYKNYQIKLPTKLTT